jgi:PAS domain S-box-containing protein
MMPALAGPFYDFHQRISEISARIIKVANEDLDAEILRALQEVLQPLGIDRGWLLKVYQDSPVVAIKYAWYAEGIEPVPQGINLAESYPWIYQQVVGLGNTWAMTNLDELPAEGDIDLRTCRLLGSRSVLAIPLFIGRKVHYVLAANTLESERDWPEEVIAHLRLLGDIVVSALRRRADDQALVDARDRLDLAAASADAGLWELDLGSGVYWGTGKIREMFGYGPDQIVTREHTLEIVHPDDRDMVSAAIARAVNSRAEACVEYRAVLPDGRTRWMHARGRVQEGGEDGRLRLMGITQDVTERKRMELQLQEQLQEIDRLHRRLEQENAYLRNEVVACQERQGLHNFGERMREVQIKVEQVAGTECTVLIEGETGTGKEVIAQAIHQRSPRAKRVLIKVNCASLPAALVESELFGREKGAFTGALSRQAGRFELADGSTLFLDEIGEMPLETQAKLLRVLQEGEFERLGSPRTIKVDVRIIAASNRDLAEEVRQGRFRRDLYYRLNVFPIRLPALRERRDDIPLLAWEFVNEFGERMGKKIRRIASRDMEWLKAYDWPGNIRELRNVIEHAMIVSRGDTLELERMVAVATQAEEVVTLEAMERRHIRKVLDTTGNRIKGAGGAAELLGINPSTLYSRMRKLGIKTVPA